MAANGEVARRYFHRLAILTGAHMCNCLIGNLSYLELPVLIVRLLQPARTSLGLFKLVGSLMQKIW